ncbi:MAG: choice-of-anchor D domain-containing protein, partial [Candidatus Nanopelagicales bacterium]
MARSAAPAPALRPSQLRTALLAVAAMACLVGLLPLAVARPVRADETTISTDNLRTGWDQAEPGLAPSSVQSSDFGRLFNTTVSGSVYGQPLVSGPTLLVTTEKAIAYGIDKVTGIVLWHNSFGTPFQSATVNCGDLAPDLGSTATGVVDPATNTYYVTTKLAVGAQGTWWLQAVDVTTGANRSGFPVEIKGSPTNDPSNPFLPTQEQQRPGLLLLGGAVYLAFGAHCDFQPYKGYVVGVSTTTAAITGFWSAVIGPSSGAGIWQSGGGLMSDGPGRIFLTTGNGFFGATPDGKPGFLGESVVRLSVGAGGALSTGDWFTPANGPALDSNDTDLGSGAPMGLPTGFGPPSHPNLLVQVGKDGRIFLLDRDNLGGYAGPGGTDNVVSMTSNVGGLWGSPSFFGGAGGLLYLTTSYHPLTAYSYHLDGAGVPRLTYAAASTVNFPYTSGSPVVTSNGTDPSSATVWQVYSGGSTGTGGELQAYSAIPSNGVLNLLWHQPIGTVSKFTVPATDGGRVYVGTRDGHVFGFGRPQVASLTFSPLDFGSVPIATPKKETVTVTATTALTIKSIATAAPFSVAPPTLPVNLATGQTLAVPVTFSGTTPGDAIGQLKITTNVGSYVVGLHAYGTAEGLAAQPKVIAFGQQPTTLPATRDVVIQNTGATTTTITAVSTLASPFASIGAPTVGSTIPAGGSVTIGVMFTPSTVGAVSATLVVQSSTGTVSVPINGTGVQGSGKLVLSPTTLDLGAVGVGSSTTASFTVSNAGNLPLTITKAKAPSGTFSTTNPLNEGLVITDNTYYQPVTFTPPTLGPFTSQYLITGDDGRGPQIVTLTGTGVAPGTVFAVSPTRLLDTRGEPPVSGGHVVSVAVLGRGGVPTAGVAAVVLNVTATLGTSSGNVAVYAHGGPVPGTSNLNFVRGQTVPNLVLAPVGNDGKVDLLVRSTGSVHLIADLSGYVVSGAPTPGGVGTVAPMRVLDTRGGSPVSGGHVVSVSVLGRGGVPSSGVAAVV